jgi:predicted nuclease with TOPRIM domain
MASIQLLLIALAPSLGTLLTIILIAFKICKRFVDLRAEVKDDKTMNALLADNKRLSKLYEDTLADVRELKEAINQLEQNGINLTDSYQIQAGDLIGNMSELRDQLAKLVQENKELQKSLNYVLPQVSDEEV